MTDAKSIDDILVKSMNESSSESLIPSSIPPEPAKSVEPPPVMDDNLVPSIDPVQAQVEQPDVPHRTLEQSPDGKVEPSNSDQPIDEYGNPTAKPKMYTDEDVQRMINERLARVRHQEPVQPSKPQQSPQSQQQGEENWEEQLESFVERTLDKKQRKLLEEQWQQQETQKQVEFEAKFNAGMNKYSDFHQVVSGKPITDSMMLATRSLDNPAAFLYGAAKLHSQELDRISRIADPYIQASEIGRLHEKMVKSRAAVSNAPKPLEQPKGDMAIPQIQQPSLEERIHAYAKQKKR